MRQPPRVLPCPSRHLVLTARCFRAGSLSGSSCHATTLPTDSGSSTLPFGSVAGGASIIHAGAVEEKQWEVLFSNFQQALAKASKRQGYNRTAAGGNQGHQRTPAMICALLKDAKAALDGDGAARHLPAGGFTDVGLHTGGSPRDTAWSLAREVFKVSNK